MSWWREYVSKRLERDPHWPRARRNFLAGSSCCSACMSKKNLEVHHVIPHHISPPRELDAENLITLCSRCHYVIGHPGGWQNWNPAVREVAKAILFATVRK